MNAPFECDGKVSRRDVLAIPAAMLVGGGIGCALTVHAAPPANAAGAPPLPWKWTNLDPLEAGQRAYRIYLDKTTGGCGNASYLSLLSLLKEKVGYPWTTMPDMLMAHAAAGFGGHGTLCGALAGASTIINMVTYGEVRDAWQQNNQIVDRLFYWYADQDFPTERFDDLSKMPRQVKAKAKTPLCHSSLSSWAMAAKASISSDAKKERCAKVAGEVVYVVTDHLNQFFAGKWTPAVWTPSAETEHCARCHGPDTPTQKAKRWNQQGHMDCLMCHDDHTA
jgi:Putative redox-active protein (C_GCAxxG_C_C)